MTADDYHQIDLPSQNRSVWFFVLTAVVVVGIFFVVRIYVDYTRAVSHAEEQLLTQTRVVDENITANLSVANLMLNDIIRELNGIPGNKQLNRYLKQQNLMTPGIRALIIIDRQGRCTYSNRDELLGKVFSNRDYFSVPRDASDKGQLFLSPPYTTISGKFVLNITKPLIGKLGEFNGVVTATLDPEYFSALLTSTIYAADNRVSMVHSDGTVFNAVPEAKIAVTGQKVDQKGSAFIQHMDSGSPTSIRRAAGKTLGDKRLFAYRTNIPKGMRFDRRIIVVASRNLNEVLAEWRMDAGIEFSIYLVFALLSIMITRIMLLHRIKLKRLDETRVRLAEIVECSDDAIVSKNLNGVILSWNAGAERLFNYHPEEALGRSITMLIPPEQQDEENQILRRLKSGELVEHMEAVRIAKGGRRIDVSVTSSPVKDSSGKIIGASKIIRDITERKRVEEALRKSEERYRTLFSTLMEGFCIIEVLFDADDCPIDYRFLEINPTFEAQTGLRNVQGKLMRELAPEHEEYWFEIYGKVALTGESTRFVSEAKALNRWYDVSAYRVDGRGSCKVAILSNDITEAKLAEIAMKKMNDELEHRVMERTAEIREKEQMLIQQSRQAALGEMIGNIAHQWRQPLNALGLTVQILLLNYDLGEFSREFLDQSVNKSMELIQHMSRTIDDFRNYFKPEKEKVEFKVSEAIANTMSLIEDSFNNQQISNKVVAKDDPVIYGYRNEFAQVLLNILNNARDALTEREIGDPRVMITICGEDGSAVVTIADNAGGIPEEIMGKIFDPYFTTKGPQQGTGVGLFMSKTIIEKNMGGNISVRNTADGAEFRIEVRNGIQN